MAEGFLATIVAEAAPRLAVSPPACGLSRRPFQNSLAQAGIRVIAEIKHRSPSAGLLRQPLDPRELAKAYELGGAAAISVVTESRYFAGDYRWVAAAKEACSLPILQKDFFSRPEHLAYGRASGADAVLLIARILPGGLLDEMLAACRELGLEALVETHSEEELEGALKAGGQVVGVNSRDLTSFTVDVPRAVELLQRLPSETVGVLESGVKSPDQFRDLLAQGVRRFLIGEYLLRQSQVDLALRRLLNTPW